MATSPNLFIEDALGVNRGLLMFSGELTVDQVDSIFEATAAVPALAQTFATIRDIEDPELKEQLFAALQDDATQERLMTAFREDPTLVDRMNTVLARDPEEFKRMLPQLTAPDADIAAVLEGSTTAEEVAAYTAQQPEQPAAADGLGGFMDQLRGMFEGIDMEQIGGNLLQMMGSLLVGLQNLVMPLIGGIMNSLTSLGGSDSVIAAGNGHPDTGPGAQALAMANAGNLTAVYDQEGATRTPAPAQQPPQQPRPEQEVQPGMAGPQ